MLAWVYDVLQRKASADALLSQNDTSVRYLTVEETFYEYLEDKYCSSHLANLAAKDILTYVLFASGENEGGRAGGRARISVRENKFREGMLIFA